MESSAAALLQLAGDFSPRYEMVRPHLVVVDIAGLGRLLGTPREIGEAFCRLARERGLIISVGIASTQTAALLLALHQATTADRLIVVRPGREAAALASLPLSLLSMLPNDRLTNDDVAFLRRRPEPSSSATESTPASTAAPSHATLSHATSSHDTPPSSKTTATRGETRGETRGKRGRGSSRNYRLAPSPEQLAERVDEAVLDVLRRWGLKTLGEFAALPTDALFERLGREGLELQEVARGRDARPLVPTMAGEPFEASLALEWPIEELEPLSFVLTRLFEPLCARLERCDRGAAVLHVNLQLVSRECHARRLELPAPMRDPKVLRTLVLLDLESHPPNAGIDRVTLTIDPTPGRIVQHSLLARPLPSPEQLSTLTARLTAVMGDNRVGAPVLLDTHRPEAFAMRRFQVNDVHPRRAVTLTLDELRRIYLLAGKLAEPTTRADSDADAPAYVLRRFRRPIPARVRVEHDRPVHVAPQGLPGGPVIQAAGPWRTSGEWWKSRPRLHPSNTPDASGAPAPSAASADLSRPVRPRRALRAWDRDEWDVALADGCLYRLHLNREDTRWYVDGALD